MNAIERAFCSVCRGYYVLRFDRTIRAHKRFVSLGKYAAGSPWVPCEGSGKAATGA